MRLFPFILCALMAISCIRTNRQEASEKSANERNDTLPLTVSKYRYYDLFKMQGSEPYDGDSCVTEIRRGDNITVSVSKPQEYSIKLIKNDVGWHCFYEIFMDKNPFITLYDNYSFPMRKDRIIRSDTIYDFTQYIYSVDTYTTLYVKTPTSMEIYEKRAVCLDSPPFNGYYYNLWRMVTDVDSISLNISELMSSPESKIKGFKVSRNNNVTIRTDTLSGLTERYDYLETQIKGAYFDWLTEGDPFFSKSERGEIDD